MRKNKMNRYIGKVIFVLLLSFVLLVAFTTKVNATYVEKEQELRAAWVSPWGGDSGLVTYKNEESFKKNMIYVLDTLEMYNMNTIIYHVRTHNNALYDSDLNPLSSYWSNVNFDEFDPLEWLIDECHKRGIEFHAWLNPYRVKSSSTALATIAENYKDYPGNPASDVNNMLLGDGTVILNPGLQNVRDFIVNSCMELIEKYDVDAIHFDDYFYCDMGAHGSTSGDNSILIEPDQSTYEAWIDANPSTKYIKTSAQNKANWRREQVDLFIEQLHNAMEKFNLTHDRYVQLGIAPTGIYNNGNGKVTYDNNGNAVTTGSSTRGQTHYSSYLFCDTVKWINNGWIDYIMPQSYWSFGQAVASYTEVMGWWNKVVEYKDVNLYSGVGLYMANSSGNTYSWQTDEEELKKQIEYMAELKNVDGASFYNFNTLRKNRDGSSAMSTKQVKNALEENCWQNIVPCAEIKAFNPVKLGPVQNLYITTGENVGDNKISFDNLENAKFYCVYRTSADKELTYTSSEIVDIFGSKDERVEWVDSEAGNYKYGIKALSYTNTLGTAADYNDTVEEIDPTYKSYNEVVADFIQDYNKSMKKNKTVESFVEMTKSFSSGAGMFASNKGANTFFSNNTNLKKWSWLLTYLKENREKNNLNAGQYDCLIRAGYVFADPATVNMEIIAFLAGSDSYEYSIYRTCDYTEEFQDGYLKYSPGTTIYVKSYVVSFLNWDDSLLKVERVKENESATAPTLQERSGYTFVKWDTAYDKVTKSLVVKAVYKEGIAKTYSVIFKDYNGDFLGNDWVRENEPATNIPQDPIREGYKFVGWDQDLSKITKDLEVNAIYEKVIQQINFATSGCHIEYEGMEENLEGYAPEETVVKIVKDEEGVFLINRSFYCYSDSITLTAHSNITVEVVSLDGNKKQSDLFYTRNSEYVYVKAFTYGTNEISEIGMIYTKDDTNPLYSPCKQTKVSKNDLNEATFEYNGIGVAYLYFVINNNGIKIVVYKKVN